MKRLTAILLVFCLLPLFAVSGTAEGTRRLTNANYVVPEGAWLEASADMTWVPRPVNELIERKAELLEHWNELVGQIQG